MNIISMKLYQKFKTHWSHVDKLILSLLVFFMGVMMTLTAYGQDTTPPTIQSISPAHGETGVALDVGTLTLTLSETVYANTDVGETYDQFSLMYSSTAVQTFEIDDPNQVSISGNVVTLKNVQTLSYGLNYWVRCYTGNIGLLEDAAGNALADFNNSGTWSFTTRSSDLYIVSTYPADGATFVDPRDVEDFTITFNQNVYRNPTWWLYIRDESETDQLGFSTTASSNYYMEVSGNTVTLKRRNEELPYGENLHFYIPPQAFKDANNRYFEGIAYGDQTTWNFSTKSEVTAPTISSLSPVHESEGVAWDISTFNIKLNETVTVNTRSRSDLSLYRVFKSSPTLIDQIAANEITSDGKGGYNLPFDYGASLEEGYQYYIEIPGDIFYDSQENYFAGTDETSWSFLANRRPTKINLSSSFVNENQPAGTVVATLSATDPDYRDAATVSLIGGTDYSSFQIVGTQLQTTEEFDYESGTTKSISLRATDKEGATLTSTVTINVGDLDDTAPVLLTSDPEDGASGVDLSPTLTYTFDEEIALTDATTSTFYLRQISDGYAVAAWQAVNGVLPAGMTIDGDQLILEVAGVLDYNTEYYISGPQISDLAGNIAFVFTNESFTTRAASTENDILTIAAEGMSDVVIDYDAHTVTGTMSPLASYLVSFNATISEAASSSITSSTFSFESGVSKAIGVQAESGLNQVWNITLTWTSFDGLYTVGDGGDAASLSYAFYQLNQHGLVGDVTFEILDGYADTGITYLYNPDPTYHVLVRPEEGASSITFFPTDYGSALLFSGDVDNFTFDGAEPLSGTPVIHFHNQNTSYNSIEAIDISRSDNLTIKNCRFTVSRGYGIRTSTLSGGSSNFLIDNCEFIIDALDNTQNITAISVEWGSPSNFMVSNNTIYKVSDSPDPQYFTGIKTLNGASIVNNAIAMSSAGFTGINTTSKSNDEVIFNTIHLYGDNTGLYEPSNIYGIYLVNNSGTLKVQNNLVYMTRSYTATTTKSGMFFYSGYSNQTISYNNLKVVDDAVSSWEYVTNGSFGHYQLESEVLNYMPNTTFAHANFTDVANGDLSLFGNAREDDNLRGTPVDGTNTDILGASRSAVWPSKGAYEVPNTASDFLTFSITDQITESIIDTENHTVTVAMNAGTSLTNLAPTFTISPGATIDKASGAEQDFTNPVTYTITDEQEFAMQEWVVTVTEQNLAPTDITLTPSSIDENSDAGTVVGVLEGTDPNGDELVFSIVGGENSEHGYLFEIDAETNELKSLAPFDFETNNELYIRIEADDQAGETFQKALVVTVNDVDEIAPELESFDPTNGSVNVALNAEFYATYNENLLANPATYLLRRSDGQLIETMTVDGGGIDVSDNLVSITPSFNLIYNTSYSIEALEGTVTDVLGNPAPAISAGSWTFSTANPITSLSPADGANDVSPFANLEITFDRTVRIQSGGTFRLFRKSDDAQIGTNWAFDVNASLEGNTITYDIPINLEPGVEVYVEILGGIEDAESNPIDILGSDTWNFTPVKLDQTVTLNPITSKVYGDTGFSFTAATASSGQNTFTYTSTNPAVADLADNYITITGAGSATIRATQAGNTYYNSAYAEQVFTVAKADQGIVFTQPDDMTYGDAPQTLSATLSPSGDEVTFQIISGDAVTLDTETNEMTVVGTGEVMVRASGLESDNYNAPNDVDKTFTVNKKVVTASVSDEEKIYGETNPTFIISYDGFIEGESSDDLDVKPVANTEAVMTSNAGLYDITLSGGEDNNYTIALENGFLTILKKELIAKADDKSRAYGDSNPSFSLSFDGFIEGENASDFVGTLPIRTTSADVSSPVGVYSITVSGGEDLNYDFVPQDGILSITQAELTVTAHDKVKNYGDGNPKLTYEIAGFKNEENSDVLNTSPEISTSALTTSDAGSYPISLSGAAANNYSFAYVGATLTINKVDLTVMAQDAEKTYGEINPEFTFSYDGFVLGQTSSSLDEQPVGSTIANQFSDAGTYPISIVEFSDTNYEIIREPGTLTISQAAQIISIQEISDKVKNAAPFDVVASVNSGASLNYAVSGPANNSGKTITLTGELGTVIVTVSANESTNYLAASEQVSFVVNDKQTQTITFSMDNPTYGDEITLGGSSDSNLPVSYEIVFGPLALNNGTLTFTGVGAASIRAIQSGDDVYNEAEPVVVDLEIGKATITATADDKASVFGESIPELTLTYDGFVYADDTSVLSEAPAASTTADETSDAGTYDITLSGGVADNYNFSLISGTLIIEKATATVTLSDLEYNEDGSAKSASVSTDPADLTVIITYDGSADSPSAAGSYEVLATIDDTNYQGSATGTLIINEVSITGIDPNEININVFPNPASEWLKFSGLSSNATLNLIDIEGTTVLSRVITPNDRVDVSQLNTGMYIIRLNHNNISTTTKILIH